MASVLGEAAGSSAQVQGGGQAGRSAATGATAELQEQRLESLIENARSHEAAGAIGEAIRVWEQILAGLPAPTGAEDHGAAAVLTRLADLHRDQGRDQQAEALYQRALAMHETTRGADHPNNAITLNNLAALRYRQGGFEQAINLLTRALEINTRALGGGHPETARSLANLATLHQERGAFDRAEALLSQALAIRERSLGPDHPDTASTLSSLGIVLNRQAAYERAEPLLYRALAIHQRTSGPDHLDTARSLNNLAESHRLKGDYNEAEALYTRALAIQEKALTANHPDVAIGLSNLAEIHRLKGDYGKAEPLHLRSLAIREQQLGRDHPYTASSLNNLAVLYERQGIYGKAETLLRRSLTIQDKALGADHPELARTLGNLAALLIKKGDDANAETLFRRALAIQEKALGRDHPELARTLNNLAALRQRQGAYEPAEALFSRALAIRETRMGADHPDTAESLNNLAVLHDLRRSFDSSEQLLRRAATIYDRALGPDHPDTANSVNNLALIHLNRRHAAGASPLLARLSRSQTDWLRRQLPLQPRERRMALLDAQPDTVAAVFLLLDQDPGAAPLALETRLNRQGLLAEIEQRQRLLAASSPQSRQLGERIADLDRQLASIRLKAPQRDALRSQRQQLEGELNRLMPSLAIKAVSTDQVAAALGALAPQGLLVEFQKFRPIQRSASGVPEWGAPRYVALLLDPTGRIGNVRLGDAAPIDQAIGRALAASSANQPDAATLWAQVTSLVLDPLQPQLRGVRELFLSPDGGLHRVPFAALPAPGDNSRFLNEAFQLRLLTTGRDLLRLQQPAPAGNAPVLIANPDYDANRRGAAASQPGRPTSAAIPPGASERQLRSSDLSTGRRWLPLPATAREAHALAPLLGIDRPITEAAATAPLVMQQRGPRILHIATHGFFDRDQPPPPPDRRSGSPAAATPRRRDDPLLRSGLIMAGANHPESDPSDDGYLTAAEVTGIDLSGTRLVTLSACETGLGDLQNGEGVYGLQRALNVAGARSSLLSLWNVEDDATRAFMEAFYSRLLRGESAADALARTQADFRRHADPLYRSPFVWAAFQLTGDWRPITAGSPSPPGT